MGSRRALERAIRTLGTIQKPGNDGKSILLRQGARSFECFRPGSGQNGGGGIRGKITGAQSRKSRKRQMVDLLEWKDGPQAWQTVGFPGEDMEGMSIRERSLHGQEVKHNFEKDLKRNFTEIQYKWKKEWKPRQSGICMGEYYPHYHLMYRIHGMTKDSFEKHAINIATLWVRALHTTVEEKALGVHTYRGIWNYQKKEWDRKPAFEWLEGDNTKTIAYACKYMGKKEETALEGEETGRSWGGSRGIPKEKQSWHWLSGVEEIWLARLLWRKWKRRLKKNKCRRGLRQAVAQLAIWGSETRETIGRLLVATGELSGTFRWPSIEDCPF